MLSLSLLLFFDIFPKEGALNDFAVKSFDRLMDSSRAREIFDLEEEEAVAVFGEMAEEKFL